MTAEPCSISKRLRLGRHNNNGDSDNASDHDDGSDDDVVHDMKMEQLEQQNGTNRGVNNGNNNNNDNNNNNNNNNNTNNVQRDWIGRIFANKTYMFMFNCHIFLRRIKIYTLLKSIRSICLTLANMF